MVAGNGQVIGGESGVADVKDLAAGSGFAFEGRGVVQLTGVPGERCLAAVAT